MTARQQLVRQLHTVGDKADDLVRELEVALETDAEAASDVQRLLDRARDVRDRTADYVEHLTADEVAYAAVADEMNDGDPGDATLDDLDSEVVAGAQRYATANALAWPPAVGDYDRYYEATGGGLWRRP